MTRPDDLLTLQAASEHTGYSVKSLRRRIADGALPAVKIGVRRAGTLHDARPIRVRRSDLDALLEPIPAAGAFKILTRTDVRALGDKR